MKKSLIALSVLAATSAFAGGGLGAVNDARVPVSTNQEGIGDYLVAPLFQANGGWQTEIKLVNTSTVYSTVAKVVLNERARSSELIDFLVFLSPGDVWNGTISCVNNATTPNLCSGIRITSKDTDSLPQFAADSTGTITLQNATPGGDFGYVNVVESAAWALGAAPVNKTAIVAQHNQDLRNAGFTSGFTQLAVNGSTPFAAVAQTGATPFGFIGYVEVRNATTAASENILAGNARMFNTLNNAASTLPLLAVQNYRNARPLSASVYTGVGTDDPANASPSYTSVGALELALNANDWVLPYDLNLTGTVTVASVTFPTRQTFDNTLHGGGTNGAANGVSPGIYAFNNRTAAPVFASVTVRDQQENAITASQPQISPLPPVGRPAFAELGFLFIAAGATTIDNNGFLNTIGTGTFQAGWANLNIDRQTGAALAYPGAPAVVTQLNFTANGNSLRSEWWYPQAKNTTGASSND